MADARDLKSRGSDPVPVRSRSPAPYRGVEQLVARRAHNPEVAGSSPASATIRKASLSQGSEAFFALNHHSSFVVNKPVLSVFVRSFWAAKWAARGNLALKSAVDTTTPRRRSGNHREQNSREFLAVGSLGIVPGIFRHAIAKTIEAKTNLPTPNSRIPEDFFALG